MIHVLHNDKLLEQRDYSSWEGEPTVGQVYIHNNIAYDIEAIIVDTRKGYCELRVIDHKEHEPAYTIKRNLSP